MAAAVISSCSFYFVSLLIKPHQGGWAATVN